MMQNVFLKETGVILFVALGLSSCGDSGEMEIGGLVIGSKKEEVDTSELEERLDELKAKYEEDKKVLGKIEDELSENSAAIRRLDYNSKKESELRLEIKPIEEYATKLDGAASLLDSESKLWKKATRDSLIGTVISGVTSTGGTVLEAATVRSITDENVIFRMNGSELTIPIEELPSQIRLKFGDEKTVISQNAIH